MAAFITCSGGNHYFNNSMGYVNYLMNPDILKWKWDFKCDCGKKTIPQADLIKFLIQFEYIKGKEMEMAVREYGTITDTHKKTPSA